MARYGGQAMPTYDEIRARVCERMGWTFAEFDATPAEDVLGLLELWRIQSLTAR